MDEETDWFNKLSFFIDEKKRTIQFGLYSIALVGIGCSLYAVRPFKKFHIIKDIPEDFITKHVKLTGRVLYIETGTPLLVYIDHRPILLASWRRSAVTGVPIELAGTYVFSNGISWLNHTLVDKNVDFIPLKACNAYVTSVVIYNKQNVSEELIKLGFATVQPYDCDLQTDSLYKKYYGKLLKLENKAEKDKVGIWDDGRIGLTDYLKKVTVNAVYKLLLKLRLK